LQEIARGTDRNPRARPLCSTSAGAWKREYVSNDGNVLTYTEDGKVIFYRGCGRGFALATKCLGQSQRARRHGNCDLDLSRPHAFKGQFEVNDRGSAPGADEFGDRLFAKSISAICTRFRYIHQGMERQKASILNIFDSKGPITILAEKATSFPRSMSREAGTRR
jgi:hypothetical protein